MSKENTAVTKKKIKRCKEDVVFDAACFIILTLVLFVVAYPLYCVIISSISAPSAVSSGKVLLHPIGFTLKGYAEVFKNDQVMRGFLNSLIITFCGVMVNLIVTLPTSYALSRSNFSGKKPITIFYLITMFFGGGLIPTYLVIQRLQMLNTIWALILPGCLSVYNMIVARTFIKSNISEELYEAAEIDGCTQARFFFQIALPLSKAIIAILVLYYGVGHWNSYFSALVYISDKANYPLQLVLRNILITNQTALSQTATTAAARAALQEKQQLIDVMKYSLIIISSIPVLVMYPLVQKHFVKGVMIGPFEGLDLQQKFFTIYLPHGKRRYVTKSPDNGQAKLWRENAAGTTQEGKIMKRKAVAAVLTAVMVASMLPDVEVIMEAARRKECFCSIRNIRSKRHRG